MEKVCTKCKVLKPLSEFRIRKNRNNTYEASCIECNLEYVRQWRKNNIEKVYAAVKRYEERNKEKQNAYRLAHYHANKEWISEQKKANYRGVESKKKPKHEIKRNPRTKPHAGSATNEHYNIKKRLIGRIYNAVSVKRMFRVSNTLDLAGCDIDFLKKYIESKFTEGMSWDRISEIHIDHIIPCAQFDLTKEEDQRKCFHYTNLQPLWKIDNLRKGAKLDYVLAD